MDTPGNLIHDVAVAGTPHEVWDAMLEMIQAGMGYVDEGEPAPHGIGATMHLPFVEGDPLVETVIGFDPPRQRRYKVEGEGSHLDHYEAAFVIEPEGDTCRFQWYLDVDDEPTPEGAEFVVFAKGFIGNFVDMVAARFAPATDTDDGASEGSA
jgi:hypothetical protein